METETLPISVEAVQRFNRAIGNPAPYLDEETRAILDDQYTYHAWTPEQIEAGNIVRDAIKNAAAAVIAVVPPGPDRSVALRKLREARMDANSAITHGGKY